MQIIFNEASKEHLINIIRNTVYRQDQVCNIKKFIPARSNQQNRYLWGVVYATIAGELGEDSETIHEICKQKFNCEIIEVGGEEYRVTKSTAKLSVQEFNNYITNINVWAWHELNIRIPEPDDVTEEMMEEIRKAYNLGMTVKNIEDE